MEKLLIEIYFYIKKEIMLIERKELGELVFFLF